MSRGPVTAGYPNMLDIVRYIIPPDGDKRAEFV